MEFLAHRLREDNEIEGFKFNGISHLLEIYADDLTVFLTPKAKSFKKIVEILESFHKISGLKISVSKTKAVWFGSNYNSNYKLCPELELNWVKNFKLLGLNFDNNLESMESNFSDKLREIEKMLACWLYRYITPYGKITIIKSLALSKLSHVALIIPNPSKQMFKRIERVLFKFLWNNKSEKVSREHAKLPEKLGGLNFPDIESFWLSFKFSWFRRLLNTSAFWPKILMESLSSIQNQQFNPSQLLQLGPSLLHSMSKKITNKFWQQVLISAQKVAEGAIFTFPEKIGYSSFWYNPHIRRNNKVVTPANFPLISNSVSTLSDFFYPNTNLVMDRDDFCDKYSLAVSENDYIEIKYIISLALQKLKLPPDRVLQAVRPYKPLLVDITLATKKGCSYYYKIIRKGKNISNNMSAREQKWHIELDKTFSIYFWENARKLCASINFENPLKWLQFQVLRNSLQTNVITSHFIPNVNPECNFCLLSPELVSHIYWHCIKVSQFLKDICAFICNLGLDFNPRQEQFLFGFLNESYDTPRNYLVLWLKKFIWNCKFVGNLSVVGFKTFLAFKLRDLKNMYILKKKSASFAVWSNLLITLEPDNQEEGHVLQVPDLLLQAA